MLTGDFELDLLVKHSISLIACFVQKRALPCTHFGIREASCCRCQLLLLPFNNAVQANEANNDKCFIKQCDQKMQYRHKIQVNAKQQ